MSLKSRQVTNLIRRFYKYSLWSNNYGSYNFSVCNTADASSRNTNSNHNSADESVMNILQPKLNLPKWNRAINDAEKLVGYPNVFQAIRNLPGEDIFSIITEIRKLVGTNHPVVKIAKRLVYNGRNNMQVRGLIILLMGNIIETAFEGLSEQDIQKISSNHHLLAEQVEMIHTAHYIHNSVVNLRALIGDLPEDIKDAEYGNKVAILVGDYLLATASFKLAMLHNLKVFDLLTMSIRHSVEGEFLFQQNKRGIHYPSRTTTLNDWEKKAFMCSGSLLSNGCLSAILLSKQNEQFATQAYEYGKQLAFLWQVASDLESLGSDSSPNAPFDLCALPVLNHIKQDPPFADIIETEVQNSEINYKKLRAVIQRGKGLEDTQQISKKYLENTRQILQKFPSSKAKTALDNIVEATAMEMIN